MRKKNGPCFIAAIVSCLFIFILLTSCGSSKKLTTDYLYFQRGADTVLVQQKQTTIQPNDVLSIQVYSKTPNQEQTAIFNIPASSGVQGYQVNPLGIIDFPVIGPVKVTGLTKDELQNSLGQKLVTYVKNPTVIVRFLQFTVNVLGEVRSPGAQKFTVDRVTLIDALSAAGDLTDFGRRQDITVIREEGGKKIYYTVDLRSKSFSESPVYVLQPNDVVYVAPSQNKLKVLSVDPDSQRKTGLLVTFIAVAVNITTLVLTILR